MSRWQDEFERHPFQQPWKSLREVIEEVKVDDSSIVTSVEEVARLRKVIAFVESLIKASDPDLVPLATWQSFQGQCQGCLKEVNNYQSNRNIQHIINANANADNLLTYVRPYIVDSGKAANASQSAYRAYSKTISEGLNSFREEANQYVGEFYENKIKIEKLFIELKQLHEKIDMLRIQYFEGTVNEGSTESRINEMFSALEGYYQQITEYHVELLDSGSDSIKNKISTAQTTSEENKASIDLMYHEVEKELKALKMFYKDIFGSMDDTGKLSGGLKQELVDKNKELDDFKELQQTRYKALNNQIEELLPGATSAGLATAYRAMRKSFSKPIRQYSYLFYSAIAIVTLTTLISSVDSFLTTNEFIKFVDITNLSELFNSLVHKLPIIVPALWLALFASKRRSESQRLQQEYAHKEALAKSYQNFKKQIDNLNVPDKKELLMGKLLEAAIDAVAFNASETLDKKHGDKMPIHEGLDHSVDALEKLKNIFK